MLSNTVFNKELKLFNVSNASLNMLVENAYAKVYVDSKPRYV